MRILWLAFSLVLVASSAWSQQIPDFLLQEPESLGAGWRGFADVAFLVNAYFMVNIGLIPYTITLLFIIITFKRRK